MASGSGNTFGAHRDVYDETGIYAGWYFEQRLNQECSRANRKGERILVFCVVVDDRSALTAGYKLWRNLRDYDLIGRAARTQFVVAALDASPEDADLIATRVRDVVGTACEVATAVFPDDGDDAKTLLAAVAARIAGAPVR
jgi:GGDEF domain-containing protein